MNYKKSRDLSWKVLKHNNVSSLPVDILKICKNEKIKVISYAQGMDLIRSLGLASHTVGNDAFCICNVIFYDDTTTSGRQRFSIAHELGHILLHSKHSREASVYNREPTAHDNPIEHEANVFASRLLAPLAVLHYLNVNSAKEIAELCEISMIAAEIRYERLCKIRKRNSDFINAGKSGTFEMSRLEQKVIKNFKSFIEENKKIL